MRIAAGTPVGPYTVLSLVGSGESGEVYRALDGRLGREVALKVLSPALAADPERVRRFEHESHVVAHLSHPGILAIYDVGVWQGTRYLVSELLQGETLRDLLRARGALPAPRAVQVARAVAEALAVAHRGGVVHRDLKPENLFLTRDGQVKILDFGLARRLWRKPAAVAAGDVETLVESSFHEAGLLVGSLGYMAPEQIHGGAVDDRADLFSLGAILYEMLTGVRAFERESPVETLHAILKDEPQSLASSKGALPAGLAALVAGCLRKDPDQRFQNARDLSTALEAVMAGERAAPAVSSGEPRTTSSRRWVLAALVLLAVLLGVAAWRSLQPAAPATSAFMPVTFRQGTVLAARFAPDGQNILYGAAWEGEPAQLFLARNDSPESRTLGVPGSLAAVSSGGRLALLLRCRRMFFSDCEGTLAEMPLAGGAPRELVEHVVHADWSPDGTALAIVRWSEQGTRLEYPIGHPIASSSGWISNPRISPDGHGIAWVLHPVPGSDSGTVVLHDLRGGRSTSLTGTWSSLEGLAWTPNGREIWFAAGAGGVADTLYAVSMDGRLRTLQHFPGMIKLEDVAADANGGRRVLLDRTSFRSELAGLFPGSREERRMSWLDASVVTDMTADGGAVLFFEGGQGGGSQASTYLRATNGAPAIRLGDGVSRRLSPDGRWALAQLPTKPARLLLLPTGAGEEKVLVADLDSLHGEVGWFPDSRHIFYLQGDRFYRLDTQGGNPEPITPAVERGGLVSPDGKSLLAQGRDHRWYLYPVPLPGTAPGQPSRPVAGLSGKDYLLRWSADGQSVFVRRTEGWPIEIERVRLSDRVRRPIRQPWLRIVPRERSGLAEMSSLVITPDGRYYAYGFQRVLSSLYRVEELR